MVILAFSARVLSCLIGFLLSAACDEDPRDGSFIWLSAPRYRRILSVAPVQRYNRTVVIADDFGLSAALAYFQKLATDTFHNEINSRVSFIFVCRFAANLNVATWVSERLGKGQVKRDIIYPLHPNSIEPSFSESNGYTPLNEEELENYIHSQVEPQADEMISVSVLGCAKFVYSLRLKFDDFEGVVVHPVVHEPSLSNGPRILLRLEPKLSRE